MYGVEDIIKVVNKSGLSEVTNTVVKYLLDDNKKMKK